MNTNDHLKAAGPGKVYRIGGACAQVLDEHKRKPLTEAEWAEAIAGFRNTYRKLNTGFFIWDFYQDQRGGGSCQ
jgi:hypothetical protein